MKVVQRFETGEQVVHRGLSGVLDAEVVYDQREGDAVVHMPKQARSAWALVVAGRCEVCDEALLREDTSLREAVHGLVDLE